LTESAVKISIASMLHSSARTRTADGIQNVAKGLPCHVSAIKSLSDTSEGGGGSKDASSGSIGGDFYELTFDVTNTVFTLPKIIVPQTFSKYTREPTQVGDKGYIVPGFIHIGGSDGVDGSVANMYPRGNLTTGVFQPISSTKWDARDPNKYYHTGGPTGYRARSHDYVTHMEIDPQLNINHISAQDITHSALRNIEHLAQQLISHMAQKIVHTAIGDDLNLITQSTGLSPHPPITDPPISGGTTQKVPVQESIGGSINLLLNVANQAINLTTSAQNANITHTIQQAGDILHTIQQIGNIVHSVETGNITQIIQGIGNIIHSASNGNISMSALTMGMSALQSIGISAPTFGMSSIGIARSGTGVGTIETDTLTISGTIQTNISAPIVDIDASTETNIKSPITTMDGNLLAAGTITGLGAPQVVDGLTSGNTALRSLIVALENLGLIVDNTDLP
jgi:hypothetical protein